MGYKRGGSAHIPHSEDFLLPVIQLPLPFISSIMGFQYYVIGVIAALCLIQVEAKPRSEDYRIEAQKRSVYDDLQAFRDRILSRLNNYRRQRGYPIFEVDPNLEYGAQAWAAEERRTLSMKHSCDDCPGYSEILAKRRSTQILPTGALGGDWAFKSWFGEGDQTYGVVINNPDIKRVGFGVAYVTDPKDGMHHAYAVGRFSRSDRNRG